MTTFEKICINDVMKNGREIIEDPNGLIGHLLTVNISRTEMTDHCQNHVNNQREEIKTHFIGDGKIYWGI